MQQQLARRWNHEPSTIRHGQFLTSEEVVVVDADGPQVVVVAVLGTTVTQLSNANPGSRAQCSR